ncbi:MAG: nitroreductase [Myxococcales bacterium]|nr:nitroreductase [Myxococcales bacterium]|tara:strand:+ start:879 stop:1421 length:543 start_codon:yes stop_codon:yes gene_type:complete
MNIYDAINQRRTVHNYNPSTINPKVLNRILAAGHMAPNHKFTWPWRFTVVGPQTRQALLPIAYKLKNVTEENMKKRVRAKLINPAALVVVTQARSESAFQEQEDYAATCCAIQNMLLAAKGEGLGSKWSTGSLTQHADICQLLKIDSEEEKVVGFIWFGEPKNIPTIERPSIGEHIHFLD